jgi:hypothetical protein
MLNKTKSLALLIAAGALLALPATGTAAGKGKGESKRCEKAPKVGYKVSGTLESVTADDESTEAFEGSVTLTVTRANGHARRSGDIPDQDPSQEGVQVAGATYTVSGDAYKLMLKGYEDADTPSAGDPVHVVGRIPRTRAKCAPEGTTLADRFGTADIRQVSIKDADPDA